MLIDLDKLKENEYIHVKHFNSAEYEGKFLFIDKDKNYLHMIQNLRNSSEKITLDINDLVSIDYKK